ncbi:MAG: hypothetical protein H6566_10040 [Lewinellaceae bacterium]|nr:hypothetical protein [Lewinellaceae bacterium]
MDTLNLVFGSVTIIAFIFSIYIYFKEESKKTIEAAKNATQIERIRNMKNSIGGVFNTIDMIIQIPKKGNISVDQLQDMARVARQQVFVIGKQLEMEEEQLKKWEYGRNFQSQNIENEITE